ncbi:GNAT family N-acetyltransferase [Oenococcus sp. UCMA 16435]|nr:GNAT family N-acetyltransferase [Oenococcus sp. UCMA 16435]
MKKRIGNNSSSAAFIYTKEEQILGLAQVDLRIMPRYSKQVSLSVTVAKDSWGRGITSRLINKCIDYVHAEWKAHVIYLDVFSDNKRASNLYTKLGFVESGEYLLLLTIDEKDHLDFMMYKKLI